MDKLQLFYPVKNPINPNNLFGATSPMYSALGQKGHPGIDFEAPLYTPIYSPVDGDAFYVSDPDHGDGLYIRVPDNAAPAYNVILWHLPPKSDAAYWIIPNGQSVVTRVKAGQLIGYTGNSGYPLESTGPHLHFGLIPCDTTGEALNIENGYFGCIDPMPFFNGKFAADINATPTTQAIAPVVEAANDVVQEVAVSNLPAATKLSFLQKVAQILRSLLNLK